MASIVPSEILEALAKVQQDLETFEAARVESAQKADEAEVARLAAVEAEQEVVAARERLEVSKNQAVSLINELYSV